MKEERNSYLISALFQVIIIITKLFVGTMFGCYTLIASGNLTLVHNVNDAIGTVFAEFENRRIFKRFPFGFGQNEFLTQIILGNVILLLGLYITIRSFFHQCIAVNFNILFFMVGIIFIQFLSANYLFKKAKKVRSEMLNLTSIEIYEDFILSFAMILVIIASHFIIKIDMIGSLIIGLMIIIKGLKTLIYSLFGLVGETKENKRIKGFIKKIINNHEFLEYVDTDIIEYKKKYFISTEIAIEQDVDINKIYRIEKKLKRELKKDKYKILLIDFNIVSR